LNRAGRGKFRPKAAVREGFLISYIDAVNPEKNNLTLIRWVLDWVLRHKPSSAS